MATLRNRLVVFIRTFATRSKRQARAHGLCFHRNLFAACSHKTSSPYLIVLSKSASAGLVMTTLKATVFMYSPFFEGDDAAFAGSLNA